MSYNAISNLNMVLKAQRMLNSIQRNAVPTTITTPITPVETVFSGTLIVPNAANTANQVVMLGGPVVQNGDGAWQVCPVTSGYGYRQPSRGACAMTVFDGLSLQVVGRQFSGSSMSHRLMVNNQWVGNADVASPQWTGYIASGSTSMTVSTVIAGKLYIGQTVASGTTGVAAGTTITAQTSGTTGGVGVYTISTATTAAVGTSSAPVSFQMVDQAYTQTYDLSSFGPVGTQKEIQLYIDENYHWLGFATSNAADRFYAPTVRHVAPYSVLAFGDSYFDAQQDTSIYGGMRGALQELLGFYVNPSGLGGQGWGVKSGGFAGHWERVAAGDLNLGTGSDLLIIGSSVNDNSATATTVRTNLATSLTTARAQNPNAFIIFISGFRSTSKVPTFNSSTPTDATTIHGAELLGFSDALGNDPYALLIDGFRADNNAGWTVISGGTSNTGRYQDADITHPNTLGYRYLAKRIIEPLEAWLKIKSTM